MMQNPVREALRNLLSYTKACEGMLNCTPAGQVVAAEAALALPAPEPDAWLWEHVLRDGVIVNRGASLTKVEPTDNTMWDGCISTRVSPLYAEPPAPREPNLLQEMIERDQARLLLEECRPYLISLAERVHDSPLRDGAIRLRKAIDRTLKLRGTPDGDAAPSEIARDAARIPREPTEAMMRQGVHRVWLAEPPTPPLVHPDPQPPQHYIDDRTDYAWIDGWRAALALLAEPPAPPLVQGLPSEYHGRHVQFGFGGKHYALYEVGTPGAIDAFAAFSTEAWRQTALNWRTAAEQEAARLDYLIANAVTSAMHMGAVIYGPPQLVLPSLEQGDPRAMIDDARKGE
jgi:hypothetical protein